MSESSTSSKMIGRYELLTRLATGGMAELFLARERGIAGLERLVVIKRILPHLADQPSFVDMFLREARIVARLSHPNVVQIFDLGHESESYHIAMEYIHGSTVRELQLLTADQGVTIPHNVSVSIIEQSCRGLHAAHELRDLDGKVLGLVHRDVSPHNLMCTPEGHVKLLDFGVAKATEGVEATYSGNLKGKFAYLSPEQCLHEPLDRRSDVFALGICLWELCTGHRLFKRRTELEMMQAVIGGDIPLPTKIDRTLPPPIERVILKALAIKRDERYGSAEEMRQDLVPAAEQSGLSVGEDQLGRFVESIAGERLAERKATL
ncbi:MAG: serine/threonine protein kinase, partial [Bradymonadaceae bacterium]